MIDLTPEAPPARRAPALALFAVLLAAAAFLTPLWAAEPERAAGLLLIVGVGAELLQSFRRRTAAAQRSAQASAGYTLLLAIVLLSTAWLAVTALAIFLAVPFALDALRGASIAARRLFERRSFGAEIGGVLANLVAVVVILVLGRFAEHWIVGLAAGIRLLTIAGNVSSALIHDADETDESVIADIGLADPDRLADIGARLQKEELERGGADRGWILSLVAVLFAIHVSRMGFDRSALGIMSPLIAVMGDVAVALALTYFVIVPFRLFLRRVTRGVERTAWKRLLDAPARTGIKAWPGTALRWWLESRLRFGLRLRAARYSLQSAFGRGLQIGLPLTAVIVASVPIWGMSWYFDTENWAAGAWNSWAAARTDTWRSAMIRAVVAAGETTLDGKGFTVTPPGLNGSDPFSFIVIGDTGEGDASQQVLRDSLIRAAAAADVRFVVLSSDVVYPTGAMKDYESRFWLPFKGVTKPVYAIPGNHDWYDALEGFAATFLGPGAARAAIRARIDVDGGVSSTTDGRIEEFIGGADFLRRQYRVQTGAQQGSFFQVQTPDFALLAVDTGVLRSVDPEELTWLRAALEASRGKMIMAVLGHPFFAGGHDLAQDDQKFMALRELLRAHDVSIVMAGDTHDLEYYREPLARGAGSSVMHHWVNGGGGAYLSFGSALAWPAKAATADWAFYPAQSPVVEKIVRYTPWWKWPAWIWTRELGAWPSSAEWLSAMFDYNVAPFFQSFVVVTVDPAGKRIIVKPWGINGPLAWSDFAHSPTLMPPGTTPDQPVEWVVSSPPR